MNNTPLFSIVIPTFNRRVQIEKAINSIYKQTYKNWEIIVIDNLSTDETASFISSLNDSRIKFFQNIDKGLISKSRNIGIKNANGEYIAFLDSDDWWSPNKLEIGMLYLENEGDIIYHDMYLVNSTKQTLNLRKVRSREVHGSAFDDMLRRGNPIPLSSAVVKKEFLLKIGCMPEDVGLIGVEDFATWLLMARAGAKFLRIPGSWGYYWFGGGNITSPKRTLNNIERIEEMNLDRMEPHYYWWLTYAKASLNFKIGNYEQAYYFFKVILLNWRKTPTFIIIKNNIKLLICFFIK